MALSDEKMLRFVHLDARVQSGEKLSDADEAEYKFILVSFLQDFAANDPEGYEREYGKYDVSAEQFEQVTGHKLPLPSGEHRRGINCPPSCEGNFYEQQRQP